MMCDALEVSAIGHYAWSGRWPSKPTRTGSRPTAIWIWTTCANAKRRRSAPRNQNVGPWRPPPD